jgi:hypothetical protein
MNMDKIYSWLLKTWKMILKFILQLYNKAAFLSNKQLTLRSMYEPMLQSRMQENQELYRKVQHLQQIRDNIKAETLHTTDEIIELKKKTGVLQNLLLKR